jgi:transitional endoplasmic reticulum ATPase
MSNNGHEKLRSFIQEQQAEKAVKLTAAQVQKIAIIEMLGALGGMGVGDDSIEFVGTKIVLPEQYEGRVPDAIEYLNRYYLSQEKKYGHNRTFNYRPNDGAHAFNATMKKMFGTAGIGINIPATFFSPERPPQMISINTGVDSTEQIPWGEIDFPPLEAKFSVGSSRDREKGLLFHLNVEAPKKFKRHIEAFFTMVEEELKKNSIYKGKAITGAENPTFVDTSKIDPKKVVYSQEVLAQLDADLFGRIRGAAQLRELGIPLKRSVLLEGPYGTGKSLAGVLTAQEAQKHGWTYILCRSGVDDLFEVLQTAQLYAPAVVWFEDIDVIASGGNPEQISKLLDLLDGVQGKGQEIIAGFTTNFVENLQKGVLRPGRIDSIIHIGELDAAGLHRLVGSLVKDPKHLGDINYEHVQRAFSGFMPAFVTEAIHSSLVFALARNGGKIEGIRIETEDLVNSSLSLRRQLELMNSATEGQNAPTVDGLLQDMLTGTINKTVQNVEGKDGQYGLMVNDKRELDN